MKNKFLISVILLATVLVSGCAKAGEFKVMDAWARPAASGDNGAVYFIISNATDVDDVLLNANTDVASAAEVHMSMMDDNGVMSMKMQEALTVPAQQEVIFKPGGLHVMLVGLTKDLKLGETITLILNFKEAGSLKIEVPVREQ
jgi:copper(I)-binding protein